jgi:beta-galactosidase
MMVCGENTITIFETEGYYQETLNLCMEPNFKKIEGENL